MTRTQQRKGVESSSIASEHKSKSFTWNPSFALDNSPLQEDASIWYFDGGKASYIANTVEQAFLLPRDMDELQNLKKHKLFLSVKDLTLVTLFFCITISWTFHISFPINLNKDCLCPGYPSSTCSGGMGEPGLSWHKGGGVQTPCCTESLGNHG